MVQPVQTIQEYFATLMDRLERDYSPAEAVFQYVISGDGGGEYHVVINYETITVAEGRHGAPTTTFRANAQDFLEYVNGKVEIMNAIFSNKLKAEGDQKMLMVANSMFPPYKP